MDNSSVERTEADLQQTKIYEDSSENAKDVIIGLDESKQRKESENNENENELPINTTENEQDDNEEVASDEEEDVPLNLEGSKSDDENLSDDDLDDLDTFQNEDQIESDKEETENESTSPNKEIELSCGDIDEQVEPEESKTDAMDNKEINNVKNESIGENNVNIVEELHHATQEKEKTFDLECDLLKNNESDSLSTKDESKEMEVNDTPNVRNDKNYSLSEHKENITEVVHGENIDENIANKITDDERSETSKIDKPECIEILDTDKENNTIESGQENNEKSDPLENNDSDLTKNDIKSGSSQNIEHSSENDKQQDKEETSSANLDSNKQDEGPLALQNKPDPNISFGEPGVTVEDKEDTNYRGSEDNLNCLLLRETSKPTESKLDEGDDDIDMDEDFDPSLLCPDIAMEVGEVPVITSNHEDFRKDDGDKSPLLYEPIFSTFVDEVKGADISFESTPEEEQKRQDTYDQKIPVQFTKVHCTACNIHLGSALDGQGNIFVHPLLKVLICKKCYKFYTSGEFEKDEDGSEIYCRWCGQGGQLLCCASCELVFCKKCIRINFDSKKVALIRDSDDWLCFRCSPSQITHLKLHCAEFMEYVRSETTRIAILENAAIYMKVDHCRCCPPRKKKSRPEPAKKKRKIVTDPDYDPIRVRDSPQPSTSGFNPDASKCITIPPIEVDPNRNGGIVQVKKGRTATVNKFKSCNPISMVKPKTQVVSGTINSSNSNFVKDFTGTIPLQNNTVTPKATLSNFSASTPARPNRNNNNTNIKNEWFHKNVRAVGRINSNISFTLTQLKKAQETATTVGALTVIHNNLQKILSTSINSLIEIRKNLRTDFIQDIKNIRLPATPTPTPPPFSASQDDDVIFIGSQSSPVPPPLTPITTSTTMNQYLPRLLLNLGPERSVMKNKPPITSTVKKSDSPLASTSQGELERPKTFLRVKSLTALQNVPSECITIPDDPPPLVPISKHSDDDVMIIEDTPEVVNEPQLTNGVSNVEEDHNESKKADDVVLTCTVASLDEPHSKQPKRIMNMSVLIHKSPKIDEMVRNLYGCKR